MGAIVEREAPFARVWRIHGATIVRVGTCVSVYSVRYQTLRSASDNHVFVVCRGEVAARLRAPSRAMAGHMHRGEVDHLKPEYWLDLQDQGYVLVRCELTVFRPEV